MCYVDKTLTVTLNAMALLMWYKWKKFCSKECERKNNSLLLCFYYHLCFQFLTEKQEKY